MQIDWITVAAQIANFLVLVWLLRRLLYGPITRAMEQRETNIRDRFAEAENRESEAKAERERLEADREELRMTRDGFIAKARDDARQLLHELENEAREEVRENRQAWQVQLRAEEGDFLHELREKTADQVNGVIRLALRDFANADLEDAMADTFIARLRQLDGKTLKNLQAEAKAADGRASVTSAFELPAPTKARLTRAVREVIYPDAEVEYWLDSDLVCGFRLKIRGQTIQWSIDAYLDDLEEETKAYFEAAENSITPGGAPRIVTAT
jgi:F-type H+-transporting ATPase subunit b